MKWGKGLKGKRRSRGFRKSKIEDRGVEVVGEV